MSTDEAPCQADARLAILAELARLPDATLNSRNLARMIDGIVPRRPSEWVEAQIAWLDSIGAVNSRRSDLPGVGPVVIATLTQSGRNHVERRVLIPGISTPADEV